MNWTAQEKLLGRKNIRKTWKHTLSPEKNQERIKQMQFCKKVRSALGDQYEVTFYFNPGGPAVWGETYVKVSRKPLTHRFGKDWEEHTGGPRVEACLSHDFSYIRQWDGRDSGSNYRVWHTMRDSPEYDCVGQFVKAVKNLATKPFVRF